MSTYTEDVALTRDIGIEGSDSYQTSTRGGSETASDIEIDTGTASFTLEVNGVEVEPELGDGTKITAIEINGEEI